MKNFWIDRYNKKNSRYWTAEFSRNGSFLLKPRRVRVRVGLSYCTLEFIGGMFTTDNELMDFLTECHQKGMASIYSRLRKYKGIENPEETETYELTDLDYHSLGVGQTIDDVKFVYLYANKKHHIFG